MHFCMLYLNFAFSYFSEYGLKLLGIQDKAKSSKKGRWSDDPPSQHIRAIRWVIDEPKALVSKYSNQKIDAVVEQVRDGSTFRVFLLPTFEHVTIVLSGVKVIDLLLAE